MITQTSLRCDRTMPTVPDGDADDTRLAPCVVVRAPSRPSEVATAEPDGTEPLVGDS